MKIRTISRAGQALLLGLSLSVATPAASGAETVTVNFSGTITLSEGTLGYPCTPGTFDPPPNPLDGVTEGQRTCPPEVEVNPVASKNERHIRVNGDTVRGTFTEAFCEATGATTNKPDPAVAGLCTLRGNASITGYCGATQGSGHVDVRVGDQLFQIHVLWGGTNPYIVRGNYGKFAGIEGDVTGTFTTFGNPTAVGSCASNTATGFFVSGTVTLTSPKAMP